MIDKDCIKQDLGIKNLFNNLQFKMSFNADNPNYFYPDGLCLFVGSQGSGKTLSAVQYVKRLMKAYPKSKLCTNIHLKDYPIISFKEYLINTYSKLAYEQYDKLSDYKKELLKTEYYTFNRVFAFDNSDDLIALTNLDEGVIYLVDEIHLYFNSLESKNINIDVMNQISQQRKQRKHIVGTCQVFGRLAKQFREQFNIVVKCQCYFKLLQCNSVINQDDIELSSDGMHAEGKVMFKNWFFHNPLMYKDYDTSYIIDRNKFISEEEKKGDIYERDNYTVVTEKH